MSIRAGIQSGIRSGIRSGINPRASTVTRDGPASWFVPQSADDFTELGLAVPDYYLLCQEAAGDLVPAIDTPGAGNLVVNATGHLYQQSVAGWARKFVGFDGLVNAQRWGTSAAQLDVAAGESYAMLVYASFTAPAATRRLFTVHGSANEVQALATGLLRSVHNSTQVSTVGSHAGLATVRQVLWYRDARDVGGNVSGLRSNLENVNVAPHNESAFAGTVKALGSAAGAVPAPESRFGLCAIFKGAKAEQFLGANQGASSLATLRGS